MGDSCLGYDSYMTQDVGSARQFFSQLRRQLGQAPRGSGWSAAACGGAGALQGALHMPRALWVSANPGAEIHAGTLWLGFQ